MIRRPPRSTPFPTRRSSDLKRVKSLGSDPAGLHAPLLGGKDGGFLWIPLPSSALLDRKSRRLNSSHGYISYAVFCLKKKKEESILLDSRIKYTHTSFIFMSV